MEERTEEDGLGKNNKNNNKRNGYGLGATQRAVHGINWVHLLHNNLRWGHPHFYEEGMRHREMC